MSEATKRTPPAFTPQAPPGTETSNRTDLHITENLETTVVNDNEVKTRKVLGQSKPGAATLTVIYTVPAATQAEVTALWACNQSATPTSIRVAVSPLGAAIDVKHYRFYDVAIGANETIELLEDSRIMLAATDVVRIYATLATVSFNLDGIQYTAAP